MANTDTPIGFRPYGPVLRVQKYFTTNNSVIGQGDLLQRTTSGTVRRRRNNYATAANASVVVGVAAHFVTSATGNARREVKVYDHPLQWFSVQVSGAQINTLTDFGLNYAIFGATSLNTAVNRTTGQSKMELDGSRSFSSATAGPFRAYDWHRQIGFITNTSFVKVTGQINPRFHTYGTNAGL